MKLIKVFLLIMFLVPFGLVATATNTKLVDGKNTRALPELESSKNEKRSVDLDHRALKSNVNNYWASIDENRSVDLDHRNLNFSVNGAYLEDTNISLGMKLNCIDSNTSPPAISDVDNVESILSSVNKNSYVSLPLLE